MYVSERGEKMVLVDKQIESRISSGELIVEGFTDKTLSSGISCDLTISCIIDESGNERDRYTVAPGETIFVKSREKLRLPYDITGRIVEKNSRMRQGVRVDGPQYQPGHETYAYLRVQNISSREISFHSGESIAQIIFEQLGAIPDVTYDKQPEASFQKETAYVGLGNYKDEYERQMGDQIERANKELENVSQRIYGNVLALMGVLIAVFSILTTNAEAMRNAEITARYVITMNASMAFSIAVLMGLILIFFNKVRSKALVILYGLILFVLLAVLVLMCMGIV